MESISLAPWKVMASLPYQADLSAYITAGRLIDPATNLVPWTDATVPGSIYRDLLREGLIKDPYYDCDPLGCGGICGMDQLRRIFRDLRLLGVLLPLLTVASLVLCPVFFDFGFMRKLQLLLPPTYFINGGSNPAFLLYTLAYTALCAGVCLVFDRLPRWKST